MRGIGDRTAVLQRGMQDTLGRMKPVAEVSKSLLSRVAELSRRVGQNVTNELFVDAAL